MMLRCFSCAPPARPEGRDVPLTLSRSCCRFCRKKCKNPGRYSEVIKGAAKISLINAHTGPIGRQFLEVPLIGFAGSGLEPSRRPAHNSRLFQTVWSCPTRFASAANRLAQYGRLGCDGYVGATEHEPPPPARLSGRILVRKPCPRLWTSCSVPAGHMRNAVARMRQDGLGMTTLLENRRLLWRRPAARLKA